jgi:hypothetical protein
MDDAPLDLDLLAASLQADSGDVRILLKVLVDRLSGALGSRLEVERAKGGLLRKSQDIAAVRVNLGEDQLSATVVGTTLDCTIGRAVGGIRIRSTKVTMQEWLRRLLEALGIEAANSEATRAALESIVIGDGQ